jgi:SAM-dependent methyltransferase
MLAGQPSIEVVRSFWNNHPLFEGEGHYKPGEKAFFEEHRRVTLHAFGGTLDRIFVGDVKPQAEVLDVGCGIGFWVHEFALRKARVSACDLSDKSVGLTRERLRLFDLTADVRQANAEELPYPDGSFDHLNCQGVIHHTPHTAKCLEEFHRVLRPGGTLSFSVYYKVLALRWQWLYRLISWSTRGWLGLRGRGRENMMSAATPDELVRLYDGSENPLGKAYTRAEIRAMLPEGLEVIEESRFGFPRRALPFQLPDAVWRVVSKWLGLMIVIRCSKRDRA